MYFFKVKPASWIIIINYLLGVSLVQLLQWIQWERQGVPMLTQQSPSLMVIILQIVNHPWWSLSCLSTATTRWLSATRLTATAPGSIVTENNTVGSRSLWPSSSCHHHQSHERHSRLWFFNSVKISTMSSLLSVILIQNKLRRGKASRLGQSVQPWVDFCFQLWVRAFGNQKSKLETRNQQVQLHVQHHSGWREQSSRMQQPWHSSWRALGKTYDWPGTLSSWRWWWW